MQAFTTRNVARAISKSTPAGFRSLSAAQSAAPKVAGLGVASRFFSTSPMRAESAPKPTKHTLPDLPYAYNALEPAIPEEIMILHHQKHHQTYVTNLNVAEEALASALASADVKKQIELQSAINFNGGGNINHSLFWKNLTPPGSPESKLPSGSKLEQAIAAQFGSVEELQKKVTAKALALQGSGWTWVGKDKETGRLVIANTKDQDPLITATPIFGIDMWEHAYYIKYKNVKAEYLKAIWTVINWHEAESRYTKA